MKLTKKAIIGAAVFASLGALGGALGELLGRTIRINVTTSLVLVVALHLCAEIYRLSARMLGFKARIAWWNAQVRTWHLDPMLIVWIGGEIGFVAAGGPLANTGWISAGFLGAMVGFVIGGFGDKLQSNPPVGEATGGAIIGGLVGSFSGMLGVILSFPQLDNVRGTAVFCGGVVLGAALGSWFGSRIGFRGILHATLGSMAGATLGFVGGLLMKFLAPPAKIGAFLEILPWIGLLGGMGMGIIAGISWRIWKPHIQHPD